MISGARPLTETIALAWGGDPAFIGPGIEEDDAEDVATKKANDYAAEFDRCVETQDYSPLCKPDQRPTIFNFRRLKHSEIDKVLSMQLGALRSSTIFFRLCLRTIDDPGLQMPIKRDVDQEMKALGPMVTERWLDDLVTKVGGNGDFVHFCGSELLSRSRHASPK